MVFPGPDDVALPPESGPVSTLKLLEQLDLQLLGNDVSLIND